MLLRLRDKVVHEKARHATRPSKPRRIRGLLGMSFPHIPAEYRESYVANFAPRPPPYLDILCPPGNFVEKPWLSLHEEMACWLEQVQDARLEDPCPVGLLSAIDFSLMTMVLELLNSSNSPNDAVGYTSENSFACPDVFVYKEGQPNVPLAVFFVDFDNLLPSASVDHVEGNGVVVGESMDQRECRSNEDGDKESGDVQKLRQRNSRVPKGVVKRLYHYMHMTGTQFGAVTCFQKTWIFKRIHEDGSREVILFSQPLEQPAMGLAFIISELSKVGAAFTGAPLLSKKLFDSALIMQLLSSACEAAGCRNTDKIMAGIVWDDFDILGDDLHGFKCLPDYPGHKSCMTAFKGEYRGSLEKLVGQRVVVKGRDLTSPWLLGFQNSLLRMVKEVDAYLWLHDIQGKCIPKLLSWGFARGAMFCYVMMSDAGKSRMERLADLEPSFDKCPEKRKALKKGLNALQMVHNRGVLHGDISDSKLVLQQQQDGSWRAALVGFAQRCYFNMGGDRLSPAPLGDSSQNDQGFYKEWYKLRKLMDAWLMTR